ncbi:hypothetical protein Cri9333_4754 (plasmid) [Crinalium epipsammum PCC 9333]|uniref:DUF7226 domain-containing protein n=1 Tax=Crinalium epipsammum PCC 9333 TaxID=1173022 RepID=K9W6W3_9CYAN|nr:hypothetical protein [Crinalium epipsammum]AFZ15529.1 hypothetical protein Cri9333_4754 [Crinalium epipsammum PCC 9333]
MTTTFSSKLVERRLNDFRRRCSEYGDTAVKLAYHAALPVALNPELLHFLRINFFLDPPTSLPYTVEFEFLTSGMCREIDDDLYEIEPEIRNVLLQRLRQEYGLERIRDVATLLWQYIEHHSPWTTRNELERAQQLTALNFLDPVKAKQWLDKAETNASHTAGADREWFIAMRQEIQQLHDISDATPIHYEQMLETPVGEEISLEVSEQMKSDHLNSFFKIPSIQVFNILDEITIVPEPEKVPFPQADKFERVENLLSLLLQKSLTSEEITEIYQFTLRQTQYYIGAGTYLGLISKGIDKGTFSLTDKGKTIVQKDYESKIIELIKIILQHEVFNKVLRVALKEKKIPSNKVIVEIMSASKLNMNEVTMKRRSGTVRGWIEWIWSKIDF